MSDTQISTVWKHSGQSKILWNPEVWRFLYSSIPIVQCLCSLLVSTSLLTSYNLYTILRSTEPFQVIHPYMYNKALPMMYISINVICHTLLCEDTVTHLLKTHEVPVPWFLCLREDWDSVGGRGQTWWRGRLAGEPVSGLYAEHWTGIILCKQSAFYPVMRSRLLRRLTQFWLNTP